MKTTFKLKGLDCANCAAKIEEKISELDGVNSSMVNFLTTKLIIEGENDKMPGIIELSKMIIKKLEPDVVMEKA